MESQEHPVRTPLPGAAALPLVTAVMITGLHEARYSMARVAIGCFQNQTYPNKQLLVINHGARSLAGDDPRIVEHRIEKRPEETVGDLRNLGLKLAAGDFIINWDDDDWHHPKRMEIQMSAQTGDAAVLLMNRIYYSFENRCGRSKTIQRGASATILHPKRVAFQYPSLVRGSDSVFADQFANRVALDADAGLYIRFYHGLNLWDAEHIMGRLAASGMKDTLWLTPEHERLLKEVLPLYGEWNSPRVQETGTRPAGSP